nr:hypothetical protein GCM10017611_80340 [Rhodococcus wratislaviensis]
MSVGEEVGEIAAPARDEVCVQRTAKAPFEYIVQILGQGDKIGASGGRGSHFNSR